MPIDPNDLRHVMGHFATGVVIVTALLDGEPCGMTANAVCSVSLEPPLVLFCADRTSLTRQGVIQSRAFALNVLDASQEPLSRAFADKGPAKLKSVELGTGPSGVPVLAEALARVECSLHASYEGGDHVIFVGLVEAADARPESPPLVFYRGAYYTLRDD